MSRADSSSRSVARANRYSLGPYRRTSASNADVSPRCASRTRSSSHASLDSVRTSSLVHADVAVTCVETSGKPLIPLWGNFASTPVSGGEGPEGSLKGKGA